MSEGYEAEGYAGTIRCSGCKSEINAYRQVTLKDVLRLEQEIEGGRGRCTLHLPITFNSEAAKWSGKSEIDEDKVVIGRYRNNASGVRYDVLKEVFFASIKCINCGEVMHMYDRSVRYDGKNTQNWVLSRKDPKALEDEKFDY
jgi:ribosomal protein S27E